MTPHALAARIFAGILVVVLLVGGTIWLSLDRSSSAGEKATTSRTVNLRQETRIKSNTRKLNATLRCLAVAKEPLRCVRRIVPGRRRARGGRGAAGAQGLQGAVGGRGTAGARGAAGDAGTMGERGATGEAGEIGIPGIPGVGVKGVKGDKGDPGRDGTDGFNGADGRQGPQGPRGPAPAQIQTACPGPDGTFIEGFATDPDGDLTYSCP